MQLPTTPLFAGAGVQMRTAACRSSSSRRSGAVSGHESNLESDLVHGIGVQMRTARALGKQEYVRTVALVLGPAVEALRLWAVRAAPAFLLPPALFTCRCLTCRC